jgi:hypothetical protein
LGPIDVRITKQRKELTEKLPNLDKYMVMMTSQRRVKMRWWNLFNHFNFKGFTLLRTIGNLFKLSLTYLASLKRWLYLY